MKVGSKQMIVAAALLLCAEAARAQTRPIVSEYFQSPVTVQIITPTETTSGAGKVVFDQPSGKSRERYAFQSGLREDIVTRYDLGAVFQSAPPDCDVTPVAGTMPLTWGWIQQAKQGETTVIDGIPVVFWFSTGIDQTSAFAFGDGVQRIATTLEDPTTPVFYELVTPERTVRMRFLNFRTIFRAKPNLFKLPRGCR